MITPKLTIVLNDGISRTFDVPGYHTIEEIHHAIAKAAGVVKFACGCVNNAAFNLMRDARDKLASNQAYAHNFRNARYLYKKAFDEWAAYEKKLLHSQVRFFHLADLSPVVRKKYGDITDEDYFEFWKGQGGPIYTRSLPMVTSLWNKYRLALIHHERPDAESLAWAMTALSGIEQACGVWDAAVEEISENFNLPFLLIDKVFSPFSIKRVRVTWYRALKATDPFAGIDDPFDAQEQRNINLGIEQLCHSWCDVDKMFNSTIETIQDYEEVFRTEGEMKKSIKELEDMKNLST